MTKKENCGSVTYPAQGGVGVTEGGRTMMFSMSLGQSLGQRQTLRQGLELSHAQRLKLEQTLIDRRRELILALRGANYQPQAMCPMCAHRLNSAEIVRGFLRDPHDISTKCPKCDHRFQARMVGDITGFSRVELAFMCPDQSRHALEGWPELSPEGLEKRSPAAYHSAMFHWGSLKAAFAAWGITYDREPRCPWRQKVVSFLGKLPDVEIARAAGVSTQTIGRYRRQLGIERFYKSDLADEIIEG